MSIAHVLSFLQHAWKWIISHWKLWGIPGLVAGTAKSIQMWFNLRKARQDLTNSQLEGRRLKAEIEKLETEKATVNRELQIEKMVRAIEEEVANLPPNHTAKITIGHDDDPEIFKEAKRRWERSVQDRPRVPTRFFPSRI